MANTPKARAAAEAALTAYTQSLDGVDVETHGEQTALSDLLADLMHLADARSDYNVDRGDGLDFDVALDTARGNHIEERAEARAEALQSDVNALAKRALS